MAIHSQYSYLENATDRGAWQAGLWGHKEMSDTTSQLSTSGNKSA